ncbi:putative lipase [Aspergillus melleus]|uniref:putative lipase n=1 Tax=Aspergillus melleus TaxID=138277 RepID=UPI001E8D9800|nr:uncharacterized protein LDX57_001361 [Aspergillus melleus]KAH8423601.1 hypothetical protein LDX57_001361 [Aspergillus melleus]
MWHFGLFPLTLVLGLLARAEAQGAPELPSNDEFYKPPSGWAEKELGDILARRPVSIVSEHIPDYEAWQLLYVTQDLYEQKTTSVTTIIVPQGANTSRILSYQIAYDSPDVNCSPSYGLQPGANEAAIPFTQGQMNYIAEILRDDAPPVLNIPDYEGSNAAFTVGPQSAYQTLDSIRAATRSGETTGIDEGAEIVLFGYSGGAYASEWAVELHGDCCAEDVNIIGAAIGGPPTNIIKTYRNVNVFVYPPLNVWAMLGVMNAIPEINDFMEGDLKPEHKRKFLQRRERCSEPDEPFEEILPFSNISNWFVQGDYFLTKFEPELTEIGVLGNHISEENPPTFPLYIFQGGLDAVTMPLNDTVALKAKFCDAGTPVFMKVYTLRDHLGAADVGSPPAMEWIRAVFNGEEIETNCAGSFAEDSAADVLGGVAQ